MKKSLQAFSLIFAISIAGFLAGCGDNSSGGSVDNNLPSAGQNAIVTDTVHNVATATEDQFKQLSQFADAGNTSAVQDMFDSGTAIQVPDGTQVEVISTAGWVGDAEVKIMSGPLSGQTMYIYWNALSPSN